MLAADTLLPWLRAPLAQALATRHGHALLVHGPDGIGQFELMLALAQAWLCEADAQMPLPQRPCGVCASCHLVQAHAHPDLLVMLPEALRERLGWSAAAVEEGGEKASKAKPSKEIRVEAVREAVGFAQTTSARGRGKVVVVYPAERMNLIAANTLLKTLEEPPGAARFLLGSALPATLPATVRSRCEALRLELPSTQEALTWLATQGVVQPDMLLAGCGGQPQRVLEALQHGIDATLWQRLPALVARGEAVPLLGLPLPWFIDALQKLCHDALCVAVGAAPRYFPAESLAPGAGIVALTQWAAELRRMARQAEHPWNAGLAIESLVQQGRIALDAPAPHRAMRPAASLHSRG